MSPQKLLVITTLAFLNVYQLSKKSAHFTQWTMRRPTDILCFKSSLVTNGRPADTRKTYLNDAKYARLNMNVKKTSQREKCTFKRMPSGRLPDVH